LDRYYLRDPYLQKKDYTDALLSLFMIFLASRNRTCQKKAIFSLSSP